MSPPIDPPYNARRRAFLNQLALGLGTASVAGLAGCDSSGPAQALTPGTPSPSPAPVPTPAPTPVPGASLPAPADSGIDHIVVVMMENRSFDHMLGWVPGADGRKEGAVYADQDGVLHAPHELHPDYQGCGLEDPPHGYASGRVHFNDGKMDGFLRETPVGDRFPIGYYGPEHLPFYKGVAEHYTVCDRYHSGILASTQANRVYMHAGETDRKNNSGDEVTGLPKTSTLRTIWDTAQEKGVSTGYFFGNLPLTALWEAKYLSFSKPYQTLAAVAAAGLLPAITYVDPFFYNEGLDPICNDDHPHADVRNGQAFLNQIYNALRTAPTWDRTLLVINYDEWGGFFDHAVPPVMPVSPREFEATGNDGRLGIRVPCMLLGPRVKKGHVDHTLFEPNSILKFCEWRWGLDSLGVRAAVTNNIATALDFENPPRTDAPAFEVPNGPFGDPQCNSPLPFTVPVPQGLTGSMAAHINEVERLRQKARLAGFPV